MVRIKNGGIHYGKKIKMMDRRKGEGWNKMWNKVNNPLDDYWRKLEKNFDDLLPLERCMQRPETRIKSLEDDMSAVFARIRQIEKFMQETDRYVMKMSDRLDERPEEQMKLKPCPVCGGLNYQSNWPMRGSASVSCLDCGNTVSHSRWNRKSEMAPMTSEQEARIEKLKNKKSMYKNEPNNEISEYLNRRIEKSYQIGYNRLKNANEMLKEIIRLLEKKHRILSKMNKDGYVRQNPEFGIWVGLIDEKENFARSWSRGKRVVDVIDELIAELKEKVKE